MKTSTIIVASLLMASFVLARAANWRIWGALGSISLIGLGAEDGRMQWLILAMAIVSHTIVRTRMDQALVVLMTAANLYVISVETLLGLVIGIETLSLIGYAILIEKNKGQRNSEAALRLAVPGMLATLLMAVGILLAYDQFGTLEIQKINAFVLTGIFIKLAVFPFSYYLVKAFEGAPVGIIIVATYGKLGILLNMSMWLSEGLINQKSLWWVGVATVLMGSVLMVTARRAGEWFGALIVGNGGFALIIAITPSDFFEWYMIMSQIALVTMLGTEGRKLAILHYLARLSFLGFPSTIIFWVKYGFLFSSTIDQAQAWGFLIVGTIMSLVGMATHHQMEEKATVRTAELTDISVAVAVVLLCSMTLVFVVV